ncbi:MAG: MaoC family dehydratase N-terminal domain-containing protein [Bifidobacteriaceae bacterium]|jgi:acyl dehydratase|nr:MaoC family dehydratase N-terminal domain-containing protein [Bifidobacteriaceae bacterium]
MVDASFAGRVYPPSEPYLVGREKLREFAAAVGATHPACFSLAEAQNWGYPDVVAAPTFAAVISQQAEAQYVADPDAQIDFSRVVHAAESIRHRRPIVAGDLLTAQLRVVSIRERANIATVTTEVELRSPEAELVATVTSTLAVRGDAA